MTDDLLKILDAEVAAFPNRASGEQLYEHINKIAACYVVAERQKLVAALAEWLVLRSEPKTMIAVDIVGKQHLSELRPALENLLQDVQTGSVFMPFYARPIKIALAAL